MENSGSAVGSAGAEKRLAAILPEAKPYLPIFFKLMREPY
jgi:hypothetical protein